MCFMQVGTLDTWHRKEIVIHRWVIAITEVERQFPLHIINGESIDKNIIDLRK